MAVIDATNLILGRMAAHVAKRALLGETIDIINCESAAIAGKRDSTLAKYKVRMDRGIPAKGPFIQRKPDRFVKRSIRGMLPYKKEKGEKAFKRIKCHIGVPEKINKEKSETIEKADVSKLPHFYYVRVGEVCEFLGWKK